MTIELKTHPDYDANAQEWTDHKVLYEGKHEQLVSPRYLWMHELEKTPNNVNNDSGEVEASHGATVRLIRQQRSRYINYMKVLFRAYAGIIFKQEVTPSKNTTKQLKEELDDIDGNGNNYIDFTKKQIFLSRFLYGTSYTLVDSIDTEARSEGEEKTLGQRPFVELLPVLHVKDWDMQIKNGEGQLRFLRHEFEELKPRASSEDDIEKQTKSLQYSLNEEGLIITEYIRENDKHWVKEEPKQVTNPKGEVFDHIPICVWDAKESFAENVKDPILQDFNLRSYAYNTLGYHGHPKFVVTGMQDEGDGTLKFSEGNAIVLPNGTSVTQINPDAHQFLREMLTQSEANIFKAGFFMTRIMPADSRASISKESSRENKEEFLSVIKSEIESLSDHMTKIVRELAEFKNIKDFDGEITIDPDVTMEDVDEMLSIVTAFRKEIEQNDLAYKAVKKKAFRMLNLPEIEKIEKSVDEEEEADEDLNPVADNIDDIVDDIREQNQEEEGEAS